MCWLPLCSAGWMVLVFIIGGLPLLLVTVGIILGSSIAEEDWVHTARWSVGMVRQCPYDIEI